jgi:hypothetical protein
MGLLVCGESSMFSTKVFLAMEEFTRPSGVVYNYDPGPEFETVSGPYNRALRDYSLSREQLTRNFRGFGKIYTNFAGS